MIASSPNSLYSAAVDPFSRSSTLTDLNAVSHGYRSMPSPQAWLVSSKRRTMPSFLDPPESPLDLLLPITIQLEDSQWNKRLSLLTHRYLREYTISGEDEIVEKAWRTLELFCVGDEAKKSLQRFKSRFFYLSTPWRQLQTQSLALDRSPSWLSFSSFLDDSFNLSNSNLSLPSLSSGMDRLTHNSANATHQQHTKRPTDLRGSFQSPMGFRDEHSQPESMVARLNPRYMTPTAASRAQVSTPEPRASTPPMIPSTGKRKAWMVSAAKRVGIVPGTPRSKKEGRIYKLISPQKSVAGQAGERFTHQHTKPPLSASPNPPARAVEEMESIKTKTANGILRSSPMLPAKDVRESGQPERPNLPDKPLPSLPIATIQRGSPVARRSLIDASEKPLRRSISPSPGAKVEEEWPTLFPSRTTTPNTNQEMGHEAASDPTGSSSGNSSGPFSRPADLERKHVDTCQHKGENTATESPNLRQGSQGVAASTTQSSTSNQTRPTSAPKVEGLKPRKKPSTSLSDAKELSPTAPDRDTLNGGAPTEIGPAKESTPGAIPSTNNNDFSPTIQATAPSQGAARAKARASRLPKRLSAPGPVRSSSSPRRTLSGRSSPYGSVAARLSRDPPLKHDQGDNSAKRPAERAKSHRVGHAVYGANLASDNIPSLVAVKQSSKQGQAEDGRSSIPRPHHRSQPHQDAESETEIVVSKLPRKKLVRNGTTTDHDSDDGDLDTDEGHKGKEGKMIPRASYPPNADKPIGQGPENEGPKMEPNSEAAVAGKAEERLSPAGETSLKAISDNQQVYRSAAADSGSVLDTRLNTSRQTPLIEKPFDRVKRLSEAAPEHGPVLRISDSADRIIMGYGSEDNFGDDETPARKRNSVPDLRRSVVVKELRKSTEGLLNGHPPLSRSSTNRSLSRNELKEQVGEAWDVRRHSDSLSEPQSVVFKGKAPRSEDPFSTWDGTGTVHTHKIARKPTPHAPLDWPLRPSLQTLVELHPVKEDSCEDSASWISPLQAPRTAMVSEHKSTSPSNNGRESQSRATGASGSASKRPYLQASHSSDREDTNSLATGDKSMLGTSNRGRSAAQNNAQYPPRTSSRVNTPDISVRPRAQIYHPSSRGIPNRFDSAHPRRLSEDFSLPKSITVDSDIFRNSIHKLKDTDKSDFATPAARETSRVQLSSAKGMLSNIKGLFHKRSIETPAPLTAKSKVSDPYERHGTVAINGSPYPNHHSRTLPAKYGAHKGAQGGASIVPTPRDAFPKTACREPPSPRLDSADYRQATDLAMSVLDAAQTEHDAPKRARLVQLAQLMVEAVNGARDAEKAMEEAKQAAARAEMHCMRTKKSVLELTRLVGRELNET